jgi:hypothetical protein
MNYPILTAVLIAVMLTACKGEGKPGQYPPSLYQEREGALSDAELEKNKKQAAEAAEKVYPADDPAVPHAESDEELVEKNVEATDSTEDSATPQAKSEEEHNTEEAEEEAHPAEDAAASRRGY